MGADKDRKKHKSAQIEKAMKLKRFVGKGVIEL
jgi:hypothetical protein